MSRVRCALALLALASLAVAPLAGCGDEGPAEPALDPRIQPPAIAEAGVLRAGVDMGYPPFAATEGDETVGLDVDVAAAVAESLGLALELVDMEPEAVPDALDAREIDVALGALAITEGLLAQVSFAGSYVNDGPALFSASETTDTIGSLAGKSVGAQDRSRAYWVVVSDYGEGAVTPFQTLREAMAEASQGSLDIVAGDAIVAAYVARDYPAVRFVAQIEDAVPLGIAVHKDADELEAAVRDALNELAADGVLDTIRAKWLAGLPELETAASEETTSAEE